MRLKIGDKVKISLRKGEYDPIVHRDFEALPQKIATIKEIEESNSWYLLKEIHWGWFEDEVELISTYVESKPAMIEKIESRFEILDL